MLRYKQPLLSLPETVPGMLLFPILQITTAAGLAIESVSVNWDHACARGTQGELMCWGYNNYGQVIPGDPTAAGYIEVG